MASLFGSPTRLKKRLRDSLEKQESDPLWRSPVTPKVTRHDGFSYSCAELATVSPSSRFCTNIEKFMDSPPRPSTPPRRESEANPFSCPPLSPSNRQVIETLSPKRHTLKLSSPKRHSLKLSSPKRHSLKLSSPFSSPKRATPCRAVPKPSPRRLALNTLDKEPEKEELTEDALNDLLASDDVRTWVQDNIAGVAEKGKISRLARVQMDAKRHGRDGNLKWVYDGDVLAGAHCDGSWFSAADLKSFV